MSMSGNDDELLKRARRYAARHSYRGLEKLGWGTQGTVFSTDIPTAIKVFKAEVPYHREVAVYRRLREKNVTNVRGFEVPRPIRRSDSLLIIEMSVVNPPYVLDFASAGVDAPLYEHTPEALAEWEESRQELFEDLWPIVRAVISEFRFRYGVFLADVKPGNIMF
jgi:hypothetical protein